MSLEPVQQVDRLGAPLQPLASLLRVDISSAALHQTRTSLDTRRAQTAPEVDITGLDVSDLGIPARDNRRLPCRLYRPLGNADPAVVLFFHSGAFVLGDLNTDHALCVSLARGSGAAVLSVGYRLAPEHPFPAALDDARDALAWLPIGAGQLQLDASRLAVAGSSAGGGLAALLAVHARDEGRTALALQLLHQPVLDDRCRTASMREFTATPGFDAGAARYMWEHYLGASPPTGASAARVAELGGLAPAFLSCGEIDPLRDEAVDYAVRLLGAGVPTELHVFAGACHGFDAVAPDWSVSRSAVDLMVQALRRAGVGVTPAAATSGHRPRPTPHP